MPKPAETYILGDTKIKYVIDNGEKWYSLSHISKFLGYHQKGYSKFYCLHKNYIETQQFWILTQYKSTRLMIFTPLDGVRYLLAKTRKARASDLAKQLGINNMIIAPVKETYNLSQISRMFPKYEFIEQYSVGGYRVDMYSPRYNIVIECDEFGHMDRDKEREKTRQEKISKLLDDPSWVRFNPDDENFSIFDVVAQITTIIDGKFDD